MGISEIKQADGEGADGLRKGKDLSLSRTVFCQRRSDKEEGWAVAGSVIGTRPSSRASASLAMDLHGTKNECRTRLLKDRH